VLSLGVGCGTPRDPDVVRVLETMDRQWRDAIADIVRDGQAHGEFAAVDPEDLALRLAVMIDGLAIQVVLGDPEVPASRMLAICLDMASRELGFDLPRRSRPAAGRRTAPSAGRRSRSPSPAAPPRRARGGS